MLRQRHIPPIASGEVESRERYAFLAADFFAVAFFAVAFFAVAFFAVAFFAVVFFAVAFFAVVFFAVFFAVAFFAVVFFATVFFAVVFFAAGFFDAAVIGCVRHKRLVSLGLQALLSLVLMVCCCNWCSSVATRFSRSRMALQLGDVAFRNQVEALCDPFALPVPLVLQFGSHG